jgi:hypothetical protein
MLNESKLKYDIAVFEKILINKFYKVEIALEQIINFEIEFNKMISGDLEEKEKQILDYEAKIIEDFDKKEVYKSVLNLSNKIDSLKNSTDGLNHIVNTTKPSSKLYKLAIKNQKVLLNKFKKVKSEIEFTHNSISEDFKYLDNIKDVIESIKNRLNEADKYYLKHLLKSMRLSLVFAISKAMFFSVLLILAFSSNTITLFLKNFIDTGNIKTNQNLLIIIFFIFQVYLVDWVLNKLREKTFWNYYKQILVNSKSILSLWVNSKQAFNKEIACFPEFQHLKF